MTDRNYTCVASAMQRPKRQLLNTKIFIERSTKIHFDKYDYKNSVYINSKTKVQIQCNECKLIFWQSPVTHMRGTGCPTCGQIKANKNSRISKTEWLERFKEVHKNKYSYDKADFSCSDEKITISCYEHGDFKQSPINHAKGHGCPHCAGCGRKTKLQAIADFKKTHGDKYDYSLVDYKGVDAKVKIICKKHGVFEQTPYAHAKGANCYHCAINEHPNLQYKDSGLIIGEFKKIHGDKYNYQKVEYKGAFSKVTIVCKEHGEFKQTPHSHKQGKGCPICGDLLKFTYSRKKYVESCKKSNGGVSSLYLIKIFDEKEIFYKVGITRNSLKHRFRKLKDYSFDDLCVVYGEAGFVYDLENKIHQLLRPFRYQPSKHFHGHTECFSKIPKEVEKLLKTLENSKQIQLIA